MNRLLTQAAIAGLLAGLIVASKYTWQDYQLNPSELFHDESGPHWGVVLETAFSWFWPVALGVAGAVFMVGLWVIRGRQ